jgi:hypothetical protein
MCRWTAWRKICWCPKYHRLVAALGLTTDIGLYPGPRPLRGSSIVEPAVAIKASPARRTYGCQTGLTCGLHLRILPSRSREDRPTPSSGSPPTSALSSAVTRSLNSHRAATCGGRSRSAAGAWRRCCVSSLAGVRSAAAETTATTRESASAPRATGDAGLAMGRHAGDGVTCDAVVADRVQPCPG